MIFFSKLDHILNLKLRRNLNQKIIKGNINLPLKLHTCGRIKIFLFGKKKLKTVDWIYFRGNGLVRNINFLIVFKLRLNLWLLLFFVLFTLYYCFGLVTTIFLSFVILVYNQLIIKCM